MNFHCIVFILYLHYSFWIIFISLFSTSFQLLFYKEKILRNVENIISLFLANE